MNTTDYEAKVACMLSASTYENVPRPLTTRVAKQTIELINSSDSPIPQEIRKTIRVDNPQPPRFYGLPKIHKHGIPLRPIVSQINAPTYLLAKHVASILQPLSGKTSSYVKDSTHFVEMLSTVRLSSTDILVSFDVESLYTNVPVQESLDIITDLLVDNGINTEYVKLLQHCLTTTYFLWNGQYYVQREGVAMGSPVAPVVANLFMESLEHRTLETAPLKPKFWVRHKEWRRVAKKERRRKIRVRNAIQLNEELKIAQIALESTLGYAEWLQEQEALEKFEKQELERINREENDKWLQAELAAQEQWREIQSKIEKARLQRAEQEIRIRKEWEQEQQKLKEKQKKLHETKELNQKKHEHFLEKLELFVSGNTNSLPEELMSFHETKPNAEPCPFFSKTGCCRFGDSCSRNHVHPAVSKTLLASNFYTHFDTDILLQYDDSDTYKEFKDFFYDVVPEFEKFGEVVQFKVCNNLERHLRGNVYVEFSELRAALAAYRSLHSRWYAGRQLSLVFCNIHSWSTAICGMQLGRRCPKGRACNFLHVFKNPDKIFDRRLQRRASIRNENYRDKENARNWRWSESPEPVPREKSVESSRSTRSSKHTHSHTHRKHRTRKSRSRSRDRSHRRESRNN